MGSNIIDTQKAETSRHRATFSHILKENAPMATGFFIGPFGNQSMVQYPRESMSTISTDMTTTDQNPFYALPGKNTEEHIEKNTVKPEDNMPKAFARLQKNGMVAKKERNGTRSTEKIPGLAENRNIMGFAKNALLRLYRLCHGQGSVVGVAVCEQWSIVDRQEKGDSATVPRVSIVVHGG